MKPAAFLPLALGLFVAAPAFAQVPEAEVARLAPLYTIDLTHGDWQHEPADICPAFTRHSFVFYHRSPKSGVRSSFMVAYPRSSTDRTPPVIVPIEGAVTRTPTSAIDNPVTVAAFNKIWSDELQHSPTPGTLPGLTWAGFAQCYASVAGEHPIIGTADPSVVPDPPFNPRKARVTNMLIPIAPPPGDLSAGVSIQLDERGFVHHATLGKVGPIVAGPTQTNPRPITTGPTQQNPLPITTRQNPN